MIAELMSLAVGLLKAEARGLKDIFQREQTTERYGSINLFQAIQSSGSKGIDNWNGSKEA